MFLKHTFLHQEQIVRTFKSLLNLFWINLYINVRHIVDDFSNNIVLFTQYQLIDTLFIDFDLLKKNTLTHPTLGNNYYENNFHLRHV